MAVVGRRREMAEVGRLLDRASADHPRSAAAFALLLLIVIPSAAAWGMSLVEQRRKQSRFHPVPTAWDWTFNNRTSCFVRVRLKSGVWVGGWYGTVGSCASAFPSMADLFLEASYEINADGSFGPRVIGSRGLYIRMMTWRFLSSSKRY
jgi:hypothetical protein